jgi:hypothetical protein
MTTDGQRATNRKSAMTTSFNALRSVVNAGAAKPHQPFVSTWMQPLTLSSPTL